MQTTFKLCKLSASGFACIDDLGQTPKSEADLNIP